MNTLNHSDTIDRWPGGVSALAADIGVKERTVRGWKQRGNIPAWYWGRLKDAARQRNIFIDQDELVKAAAARRRAA